MIARLRGVLVERSADAVVIDCGGVGYDVHVPLTTLAVLPEPGTEVTLRVFTHATENRIALFGFATAEERQLFDLLITVKNVGPTTAMAILSGGASPSTLARMICDADLKSLTRIRGVGKKTAEMLVVELREKCEQLIIGWSASGKITVVDVARPSSAGFRSPLLDDVSSALVHMGWRAAEVEKTVARLSVAPEATVESLLREALRGMPR
jgi:holliday junction DNA helicase RuvA